MFYHPYHHVTHNEIIPSHGCQAINSPTKTTSGIVSLSISNSEVGYTQSTEREFTVANNFMSN